MSADGGSHSHDISDEDLQPGDNEHEVGQTGPTLDEYVQARRDEQQAALGGLTQGQQAFRDSLPESGAVHVLELRQLVDTEPVDVLLGPGLPIRRNKLGESYKDARIGVGCDVDTIHLVTSPQSFSQNLKIKPNQPPRMGGRLHIASRPAKMASDGSGLVEGQMEVNVETTDSICFDIRSTVSQADIASNMETHGAVFFAEDGNGNPIYVTSTAFNRSELENQTQSIEFKAFFTWLIACMNDQGPGNIGSRPSNCPVQVVGLSIKSESQLGQQSFSVPGPSDLQRLWDRYFNPEKCRLFFKECAKLLDLDTSSNQVPDGVDPLDSRDEAYIIGDLHLQAELIGNPISWRMIAENVIKLVDSGLFITIVHHNRLSGSKNSKPGPITTSNLDEFINSRATASLDALIDFHTKATCPRCHNWYLYGWVDCGVEAYAVDKNGELFKVQGLHHQYNGQMTPLLLMWDKGQLKELYDLTFSDPGPSDEQDEEMAEAISFRKACKLFPDLGDSRKTTGRGGMRATSLPERYAEIVPPTMPHHRANERNFMADILTTKVYETDDTGCVARRQTMGTRATWYNPLYPRADQGPVKFHQKIAQLQESIETVDPSDPAEALSKIQQLLAQVVEENDKLQRNLPGRGEARMEIAIPLSANSKDFADDVTDPDDLNTMLKQHFLPQLQAMTRNIEYFKFEDCLDVCQLDVLLWLNKQAIQQYMGLVNRHLEHSFGVFRHMTDSVATFVYLFIGYVTWFVNPHTHGDRSVQQFFVKYGKSILKRGELLGLLSLPPFMMLVNDWSTTQGPQEQEQGQEQQAQTPHTPAVYLASQAARGQPNDHIGMPPVRYYEGRRNYMSARRFVFGLSHVRTTLTDWKTRFTMKQQTLKQLVFFVEHTHIPALVADMLFGLSFQRRAIAVSRSTGVEFVFSLERLGYNIAGGKHKTLDMLVNAVDIKFGGLRTRSRTTPFSNPVVARYGKTAASLGTLLSRRHGLGATILDEVQLLVNQGCQSVAVLPAMTAQQFAQKFVQEMHAFYLVRMRQMQEERTVSNKSMELDFYAALYLALIALYWAADPSPSDANTAAGQERADAAVKEHITNLIMTSIVFGPFVGGECSNTGLRFVCSYEGRQRSGDRFRNEKQLRLIPILQVEGDGVDTMSATLKSDMEWQDRFDMVQAKEKPESVRLWMAENPQHRLSFVEDRRAAAIRAAHIETALTSYLYMKRDKRPVPETTYNNLDVEEQDRLDVADFLQNMAMEEASDEEARTRAREEADATLGDQYYEDDQRVQQDNEDLDDEVSSSDDGEEAIADPDYEPAELYDSDDDDIMSE